MKQSYVGPLWDEILRRQALPDKDEHFHWAQIVVNDMPAAPRYDNPLAPEEARALKSKKRRKNRTREAPRAKKQHVQEASEDESQAPPPKGKKKSLLKRKGNQKRKSRDLEEMQTTTEDDSTEDELPAARKIATSKAGPSSAPQKRGPAARPVKKPAPVPREPSPDNPTASSPGSPQATSTNHPAAVNADISAAHKVPVPPPDEIVGQAKHRAPVWALKNKNPFAYLWALTDEPEYQRLLISWRHLVRTLPLSSRPHAHAQIR